MCAQNTLVLRACLFIFVAEKNKTNNQIKKLTCSLAKAPGMTNVGVPNQCVFIYNLPSDTDEGLVYRLFGSFGGIVSVKIVRDPKTQACKGFAFVNYTRIEDASAVCACDGHLFEDTYHLSLSFA